LNCLRPVMEFFEQAMIRIDNIRILVIVLIMLLNFDLKVQSSYQKIIIKKFRRYNLKI